MQSVLGKSTNIAEGSRTNVTKGCNRSNNRDKRNNITDIHNSKTQQQLEISMKWKTHQQISTKRALSDGKSDDSKKDDKKRKL
jgi:hypothetical protein